jgi:hypothetical protein
LTNLSQPSTTLHRIVIGPVRASTIIYNLVHTYLPPNQVGLTCEIVEMIDFCKTKTNERNPTCTTSKLDPWQTEIVGGDACNARYGT